MNSFTDQRILQYTKEVRESGSAEEIAQLLSSGNWIAIFATGKKLVLIRIA